MSMKLAYLSALVNSEQSDNNVYSKRRLLRMKHSFIISFWSSIDSQLNGLNAMSRIQLAPKDSDFYQISRINWYTLHFESERMHFGNGRLLQMEHGSITSLCSSIVGRMNCTRSPKSIAWKGLQIYWGIYVVYILGCTLNKSLYLYVYIHKHHNSWRLSW